MDWTAPTRAETQLDGEAGMKTYHVHVRTVKAEGSGFEFNHVAQIDEMNGQIFGVNKSSLLGRVMEEIEKDAVVMEHRVIIKYTKKGTP